MKTVEQSQKYGSPLVQLVDSGKTFCRPDQTGDFDGLLQESRLS
jgi:hypothetical protein